MNKKEFQYYLESFLTSYLNSERNLSSNTIQSYADTFKLLLIFFNKKMNIKPNKVALEDITKENVIAFLNWLENDRDVCIATRNIRLAAIHSFIKYVQLEDPSHLHEYQKILSIKKKKHQKTVIKYLTIEQIKKILEAPDGSSFNGLRDKTLLTVLYDTGMRVNELIELKYENIRLEPPACVTVIGKGNKKRVIPIMGKTVQLLKEYMHLWDSKQYRRCGKNHLFLNHSNHTLTRAGIRDILNRYVEKANQNNANITINVHPHVLRHSKAVHLLEAGIELIYIRDFLGHSSVTTTEIYAKVTSANKLAALEKAYQEVTKEVKVDWNDDSELMDWLSSLTKK